MQFGVLVFICMLIMLVFGIRIPQSMQIKRIEMIMFCVSVLVLNCFTIEIVPEFSLLPSTIAIILFMLGICIERDEFLPSKILCYGGLTLVLMLGVALLMSPENAGIIGIAAGILPIVTGKRLYLSMFCATSAVLLVYAILVLVGVNDYATFNMPADQVLDVMAAAMLSVFCTWQFSLHAVAVEKSSN